VRDFTAPIAAAYRLARSRVTLSGINNHDLPGSVHLLKHKQRLKKLWQETRDPACKTSVSWAKKTIRKMSCRKAPEQWKTKIGNYEVTPQAVWLIVKSVIKRDGPMAPTTIHGPSGHKYCGI
jgi:hypothetical protein